MPHSADHAVDKPWARTAPEVLESLEVSPERGLDDSTVQDRRKRYGRNRLKPAKSRGVLAIFLEQFKNLIILLLAAAAVVSFLFGQRLESIAILVAISLNVAIGFFTEWRATRSMEALRKLGRVEAKVRRGGKVRTVEADMLVPGDMVVLEGGDIVAADMRIVECNRLHEHRLHRQNRDGGPAPPGRSRGGEGLRRGRDKRDHGDRGPPGDRRQDRPHGRHCIR
jgi:Ca2+-transporting ATPase